MKYIIRILMVLSVVLFFSGCEKDNNGRMPDNIQDSNVGILTVTEADPFINVSTPDQYSMTVDVDLLFDGTFKQIDIMVVMNGDFKNQYKLGSVTSVPKTFTFTSQDLVDAIPTLNSVNDIVQGDKFVVFTTITLSNGTVVPGYTSFGKSTTAPTTQNVIDVLKGGAAASVNISVPCEFVLADYLGTCDITEYWAPDLYEYQVDVIEDPDYTGDKIGLVIDGIWDGTWKLRIEVDTYDFSIVGTEAEQHMAAEVFGYHNPVWGKISGNVQTCEKHLVVNIGSFCVDEGCFGGMPIVYTTTKVATKKSTQGANGIIMKAPRGIE